MTGTLFAQITWVALFAGTIVQLSQGAAKRFDFALVGELLAFCEFNELQNFFHLVNGAFERFDDLHHLVDRLADGGAAVSGFSVALTDALGQTLDAFQKRSGLGRARRCRLRFRRRDGRRGRFNWG